MLHEIRDQKLNTAVPASIGVGLLLGAWVSYAVGRRLVLLLATAMKCPSIVRVSGALAGLVALVPSSFIAFVVGGNFGGGIGAELLPRIVGVPLGIALGIGSVLALCLLAGSLSGALLGCGISAFVGRLRPCI
jgi:hypothetical protein